MVCIPCFIVPVVLFFWRWLIQPYFYKYIWNSKYNPWKKDGNEINESPEFIKKCEGGVCTFMRKPAASSDPQTVTEAIKDPSTKKDD